MMKWYSREPDNPDVPDWEQAGHVYDNKSLADMLRMYKSDDPRFTITIISENEYIVTVQNYGYSSDIRHLKRM